MHCTVLYTILLYSDLSWSVVQCTLLKHTPLYCNYSTVLHCGLVYCTMVSYTVLCYILLHCTALYCTALYSTILHRTVQYYSLVYCTVLYYGVLKYIVLHWTVLYCSIPHCGVLLYYDSFNLFIWLLLWVAQVSLMRFSWSIWDLIQSIVSYLSLCSHLLLLLTLTWHKLYHFLSNHLLMPWRHEPCWKLLRAVFNSSLIYMSLLYLHFQYFIFQFNILFHSISNSLISFFSFFSELLDLYSDGFFFYFFSSFFFGCFWTL